MRKINCRNEEDFKCVYDRYFNMVYKISLLYLKNTQEAEDAVQEVFIKLLKKEGNFNSEEHIKAWLIVVTKNSCKDRIKSFWRSRRVDIEKLPELTDEKKDSDLYYVLEELLLLPERYKIVLYLFYYEDDSVRDISKILNRKESTIQTQLARGRKMLEKNIKGGIK